MINNGVKGKAGILRIADDLKQIFKNNRDITGQYDVGGLYLGLRAFIMNNKLNLLSEHYAFLLFHIRSLLANEELSDTDKDLIATIRLVIMGEALLSTCTWDIKSITMSLSALSKSGPLDDNTLFFCDSLLLNLDTLLDANPTFSVRSLSLFFDALKHFSPEFFKRGFIRRDILERVFEILCEKDDEEFSPDLLAHIIHQTIELEACLSRGLFERVIEKLMGASNYCAKTENSFYIEHIGTILDSLRKSSYHISLHNNPDVGQLIRLLVTRANAISKYFNRSPYNPHPDTLLNKMLNSLTELPEQYKDEEWNTLVNQVIQAFDLLKNNDSFNFSESNLANSSSKIQTVSRDEKFKLQEVKLHSYSHAKNQHGHFNAIKLASKKQALLGDVAETASCEFKQSL